MLSAKSAVSSSAVVSRHCAIPFQLRRLPVAAKAEQTNGPAETAPQQAPLEPLPSATTSTGAVQDFQWMGSVQEAINGRSAMLGFFAALIAEASTHQTVWSQIAGKYVNLELVEKPLGAATLGFGAIVALVTVASLAPKMLEGLEVDARSFGPFTPEREKLLGRVAMMGFLGLLVLEGSKGSSLL